MSSINKAIIVGNISIAPEAFTSGCSFSVATNETWKDKNTGEKKERAEFHRIKVFGKLSEICLRYLTKGKLVYIEGKINTSTYEKDGIKRYSTDIIASEMRMLGGKDSSDNSGTDQSGQAPPPQDDSGSDPPF